MKKILLFLTIVLLAGILTTKANNHKRHTPVKIGTEKDSTRLAELDRYWTELARTVEEGDFEGYKAAYQKEWRIIFIL